MKRAASSGVKYYLDALRLLASSAAISAS